MTYWFISFSYRDNYNLTRISNGTVSVGLNYLPLKNMQKKLTSKCGQVATIISFQQITKECFNEWPESEIK